MKQMEKKGRNVKKDKKEINKKCKVKNIEERKKGK
jgi:hypothetical protein